MIKELRVLIEKDTTNYNLRNAKEQWLEKLRYKKIKFAKCEEKRRRKQDNLSAGPEAILQNAGMKGGI